jgi:hypothetical protein
MLQHSLQSKIFLYVLERIILVEDGVPVEEWWRKEYH